MPEVDHDSRSPPPRRRRRSPDRQSSPPPRRGSPERRDSPPPRQRSPEEQSPPPRRRRSPERQSPPPPRRRRSPERQSPPPPRQRSPERQSPPPPRRRRSPADRQSPPSKRQSITERLISTWNSARKDPKEAVASVSRRSSSSSKPNPVAKVREWLDTCNVEHGDHCSGSSSSSDIATWRPIWLIDSVERCLVRAKAADRYIALSYVWERAPLTPAGSRRRPTQTVRGNLDMLTASMDDAEIPQTVADAMSVSRKLGIRYLWVDRFCIVQDDEAEKEAHIRHMAYIYANAYLTIVAASGDANTGLVGLLRKGPKTSAKKHEDLLLNSRWNTRAWTLQELLYSRRTLFVFTDTITWECHCDLWQGSGPTSKLKLLRGSRHQCTNRVSQAAYGFQHSPWPDVDEYARIAMDYSARKLTYVQDTTNAFLGITTVLSKSFAGGFIFGMPVMFLDIALLWRPQSSIRRRQMQQPSTGLNPIPSWSWMGWFYDGVPADLTLWRAAADYVEDSRSGKRGQPARRFKSPNAFRLRSMVTYHLTDRATTAPMANNGLEYRDRRHRRTAPLPPGWSRTGSSFKHISDDLTTFKYPIPVASTPDNSQETPILDFGYPGTLLSFNTSHAFFETDFHALKPAASKGPTTPPLASANIWSPSGRWVGHFWAHDSWLGIQGSNYDGDEKLEFVAISSGSERGGSHVFDMEFFKDNMDKDEIVDFVNVLWIERVGNIAYRRGLGHIVERAWEVLAKDRVDILLG